MLYEIVVSLASSPGSMGNPQSLCHIQTTGAKGTTPRHATSPTLIPAREGSISPGTRRYLLAQGAIYGHQASSTVTRRHLLSQGVIYCHKSSSTVTRRHLLSQGVIYCHKASTVTRRHLLLQGVIYCHKASSTVTRRLLSQGVIYCYKASSTVTRRGLLSLGVMVRVMRGMECERWR